MTKPETLAHPLTAETTEETLYRTATVLAFLASQDRNGAGDGEVGFGRNLILRMCASTLLHESDKAGRVQRLDDN
jgi:hypothetical protein